MQAQFHGTAEAPTAEREAWAAPSPGGFLGLAKLLLAEPGPAPGGWGSGGWIAEEQAGRPSAYDLQSPQWPSIILETEVGPVPAFSLPSSSFPPWDSLAPDLSSHKVLAAEICCLSLDTLTQFLPRGLCTALTPAWSLGLKLNVSSSEGPWLGVLLPITPHFATCAVSSHDALSR